MMALTPLLFALPGRPGRRLRNFLAAGRIAPPHPAPEPDRVEREGPGLALDSSAALRLRNKLLAVVCSKPWEDHCYALIIHGRVPYKEQQARELDHAGVYPPGGSAATGMRRCGTCRKLMPTNTVGSVGVCLDCYYAGLPLARMVQVPSSASFVTAGESRAVAVEPGALSYRVSRRRASRRGRMYRSDEGRSLGWFEGVNFVAAGQK